MKRSDIAALIVVASISMIIAYFVADGFFGTGGLASEKATVKTANKITAEVVQPDSSIFNKDAINPTVEVLIGDSQLP